jgi:hypothetical protein
MLFMDKISKDKAKLAIIALFGIDFSLSRK